MEICWKNKYAIIDDNHNYKFYFDGLSKLEKINVSNILFLGAKIGINNWEFYYEDSSKFERLLRSIAEDREYFRNKLHVHANRFNANDALWCSLICRSFNIFNMDMDIYICCNGLDGPKTHSLTEVNSISDVYNCLVSLLPENIEKTRKLALEHEELERKKEEEEKRKLLIRNYMCKQQEVDASTDYSESDYYSLLEKNNSYSELKNVTNEIQYWEKGMELNIIGKEWGMSRIDVLRKKIIAINKVHRKKLLEKLFDQFGTIEDLKLELLKLIKGLDFNEALALYNQYYNITKELESDKSTDKFREALSPYDIYIEFYQNASIFVSNYLNEINKFKSKKVLIPQSKINTALMYMYNTRTVEEALALRKQKDYIENRGFGDKGEAEVDYALKWLIGDYIKVERTPSGKYGKLAIVLNNKDLIDEPQEFDHIVFGPQGIFNIETKNYSGKLIIDANGNWIRIKTDGREVGERNPFQQIRRHESVLKSIFGKDVPIISILVMANPKMIIEGIENFPIPLLKSDRLEEYISTYKNNTAYTKSQLNDLYNLLEQYRVSK